MKRPTTMITILMFLLLAASGCSDTDTDTPLSTGDTDRGPFDVMLTVLAQGSSLTIDLADVDHTTFDQSEAVRLSRVVEQAALSLPWNHHYNFIANDGWSILADRLGSDPATLPYYGALEHGFLYWTDSNGLVIGWEPELGFPRYLNVKHMEGAVIEAITIHDNSIIVHVGATHTIVELSEMTTTDYVDYKHPEDGAIPVIPLKDVFDAAGLTDAVDYAYKYYGKDGFSNNDENLMPYENATKSYIRPDTRRILTQEAWDTDKCCWRTRDTILIRGLIPAQ